MSDEPWEAQRKMKYRDHDLPLEDLTPRDVEVIRGAAVRDMAESRENDRVKLIIGAYLGYLTSKGYRVVSKEVNDVTNATVQYWPHACDICLCTETNTCAFCAVTKSVRALEKRTK